LKQGKDFKGQKTYPLSSQMIHLVHETDVSSSCGPEDGDFKAFVEATSLVGGRDEVEEFLASGLWPLGHHFSFSVETKESPLSKITMPMPQIETAIREQESGAKFATRIEKVVVELVGRYILVEHRAYRELHHGRVNRVFELAGFLCQPRPEPAECKCKMKSSVAAAALAAKKISGKRGCGKKSGYTKTHTSSQELTLAKPLGRGNKFSAKSSGLCIVEKASLVGIDAASSKPKRTINLFGSNSSASDDESASPRRPRKRARESRILKQFPELVPSGGVCF
jgi:hypothetical protein